WMSDGTSANTTMVKDINPGAGGSDPTGLTNLNNVLYFTADDGTNGRELWMSDGTSANTTMVNDINTGSGDSNPTDLTLFNGKLYFAAENGDGPSLWVYDGSDVTQVTSPLVNFNPANQTAIGNDLFFTVSDGSLNRLKKIDGAGTVTLLKTFAQELDQLTAVGSELFFTVGGTDIWKYNGTDTVSVATGLTDTAGSLTDVNGTLFFTVGPKELWKSDGTPAGTSLVKSFSATLASLTAIDDTLFFTTGNSRGTKLWMSDGTEAGTVQITDKVNGDPVANPAELTAFGNKLTFTVGGELWKTQLNNSSQYETGRFVDFEDICIPPLTVEVLDAEGDGVVSSADGSTAALYTFETEENQPKLDLTPVVHSLLEKGWTRMTLRLKVRNAGDEVKIQRVGRDELDSGLIVATAEQPGVLGDLYTEDGKILLEGRSIFDLRRFEAGTFFLRVYDPFAANDVDKVLTSDDSDILNPTQLTTVNNMLFFVSEGNLWRSNGTSNVEVKTLTDGKSLSDSSLELSNIQNLTTAGDVLFFTALYQGTQNQLWKSDGIFAEKVKDLPGLPADLIGVNDLLLFTVGGTELYKSDGTAGGTVSIKTLPAAPAELTASGDFLFFVSDNKVWKSDGTAEGTSEITTIQTGTTDSDSLIAANGDLFYTVANGGDVELWSASGSEGRLVKSITGASDADLLAVVNGSLFFTVFTSGQTQLWKSDGTEAGTVLVEDLVNGNAPVDLLKVEKGTVFFTVDTGGTFQLWKSSGFAAGTKQVISTLPGTPEFLTDVNGTLYFVGQNDTCPTLWKSDGTSLELVASLSGSVDSLTDVNGVAYLDILENARAELNPPGPNNDIIITAASPQASFNGAVIQVVDDGSQADDTALATYDQPSNTLTINICNGVTTAQTVLNAINSEGTFTAELNTDTEPGNTGEGVINTAPVTTDGGADLLTAELTFSPVLANNDLHFKAPEAGKAFNGVKVRFVNDDSITGDAATATYDPDTKTLTVYIREGMTTANTVITAINNDPDATGFVTRTHFTMDLADGNNGSGLVHPTTVTTDGGSDDDKAHVTILSGEDHGDIFVEAGSTGAGLNGVTISLVDDPDLTGDSAEATYDEGSRTLTIKINEGETTASTVVDAVNNDAAAEGFRSRPNYSISLVSGNDGTGLVFVTEGTIDGGSDPAKATATIDAPGPNNDVLFTAKADGSAANGILIKVLGDGTISGDNASAAFDPLTRTLTIRINPGVTTADTVVTAVEAEPAFSAIFAVELNSDTDPGNTGDGVINTASVTTSQRAAIWRSDGTSNGTVFVYAPDSAQANPAAVSGTSFHEVVVDMIPEIRTVNGTLFFTVGHELWRTFHDGVVQRTLQVKVFSDTDVLGNLTGVGGALFFTVNDNELWKSDGTADGTTQVFTADAALESMTGVDNALYFRATKSGKTQLWKTGGTVSMVPFAIYAKTALQGATHPGRDRDEIHGGDGDDVIIGNSDVDRLVGESGQDVFIGESIEIRDLESDEGFTLPPTSEFSTNHPRPIDPEISIPDAGLKSGIAEALGIPVTTSYTGEPLVSEPIYGSDLGALTALQLDYRGIKKLDGVEFAYNLE
ncbi:MAG: hypothetical protein DRH43_07855, partial [Deltaproteobacteria bacterium]